MQAQAGSSAGSGSALQNPKVLIAVIAVGAIAIIALIWMMVPKGDPPADIPPAAMSPGDPMGTGMPGGNGPALDPGLAPPGAAPGMAPGVAPDPAAGGFGAYPAGGTPPAGQPAQAADQPPPKGKGPGVPVRRNPFVMNAELRAAAGDMINLNGPAPTEPLALQHSVWQELQAENPPQTGTTVTQGEDEPGPPIPPMRVAAVQRGAQVAAVVQIGSEYFHATPGKMIPEQTPVYRVEQIESDRVVLTRRWEDRGKKGVQRIEVTLQAGSNMPGVAQPGLPGGPGAFGGGGNGPGGFRRGMTGNGP